MKVLHFETNTILYIRYCLICNGLNNSFVCLFIYLDQIEYEYN